MEHDPGLPATHGFAGTAHQPLIGVLVEEDGRRVVRYSVDDPAAACDSASDARLKAALSVIGAWSDLDWAEFSADLDRIRNATPPTPPIDL